MEDCKVYDSSIGTIKVYVENSFQNFYCDVDNRYDKHFSNFIEMNNWLISVNAEFVGYDHD